EVPEVVVVVAHPRGIRGPAAQDHVGQERLPAVGARRGEVLDVGGHLLVRVDVPGRAVGEVVAGVVPGDVDVAGGLVDADGLEEPVVVAGAVIHLDRSAPGRSIVVGVADQDLHVVVADGGRVGIDEVKPAAIQVRAPVVGEVGAGEGAPVGRGGNEV